MRIVTLVDNSTWKSPLLAEHGLSFYIESGSTRIVFDTGQSGIAVPNAATLGLDVRGVDAIVLSHGHHDHAGGLRAMLQATGPVRVTAHPDVWSRHHSRRKDGPARYAGIPFVREVLESAGGRFDLSAEPVRIGDTIFTTGEVPPLTSFERVAGSLVIPAGDDWAPDPLADDLSLGILTPAGLVVVLGCAHRGMVNSILRLREVTGEKRIACVVGGTHLGSADPEQVEQTIAALRDLGVGHLGVSHCTGPKVSGRLAQAFGDRFFFNNGGTVIQVGQEVEVS